MDFSEIKLYFKVLWWLLCFMPFRLQALVENLLSCCHSLYIAFFCKGAIALEIMLSAAGVCIMRLFLSLRLECYEEGKDQAHQPFGNLFVGPKK